MSLESAKWIRKMMLILNWLMVLINISVSQSRTLEFYERIETDSIYLDLKNHLHGPVFLKFQFDSSVADVVRGPKSLVIQPQDSLKHLFSFPRSIIQVDSLFNWSDYMDVTANLGDPYNSSHDDGAIYVLPFLKDKKYQILQSWNGSFSHYSVESKFAIDFTMPEGDTICAARSGVVVRTDDQYSENGGKELKDKANQIVILHNDGTLAFYVHLLHKGVLVRAGEQVHAGQVIGLSGNTGYSTRPHLHFVVREAPGKAIPIYFKGYQRKKINKGKWVKRKAP